MADGQLCTIVAKPHPLDCDTVYAQAQAGLTIAQMLGEGVSHTCRVTVEGVDVPRALWAKVKPKAGRTLHVMMVPQGGGNGSKWLRLVAMVVVMIVAWYAAPYLVAAYGGTASVWAAGIMMVGTLAINALIPPPTPKALGGGDPFQQLASLTGTSNQASPYGVIPCVVGSTRYFPPHAALPYTEILGDQQYLRMLLDLGYGDLDVSDIRIGETAIDSYDDVEYEISTAPTLFSQDIYELSVGVALNGSGDNATRTTQAATQEISLDIIFGQGLFGVNAKNKTVTGTVNFTVVYRAVGATPWTAVGSASGLSFTGGMVLVSGGSGANVKVSSTARKTLRCGIRWKVPSGQYEVMVTRNASDFSGAAADAQIGAAAWSVLRSVNPQLPSTSGTTKLAVRIKATDQLNGVVQNLSVLASQKIRRWDAATSTWLAATGSTNPAWIYLWLMTQCPAVMRRLADSRMDIEGIADWADECTAKGYAIGFVMDSGRAFGDVIRDVLAAGRASFGLRNSLYSAVRDIAQTVPVQMFTPSNSWGFSYSRSFIDLPHALRVSFTNPEASYQQDVRLVYADGYTEATATRFEELDLRMVIDPDAAWRLGRYHLSVAYNRPNQYTWQADIEHMVCERGDLVHVAHDVTGWGVAWGRIKAISGSTVTLDGPVTLEAGKTYAFRVRKPDNTQATETITSAAGDVQTLTLAAPLTSAAVGDLFVIGEVNRGVAQLIVRKIEPGDDLTATITAVDAAPDVWTADSGTPPAFVSDISGKAWCSAPAAPVVHIRAGDSAPDDAGVIQAHTGVGSTPGGGIHRLPIYNGDTGGTPRLGRHTNMVAL